MPLKYGKASERAYTFTMLALQRRMVTGYVIELRITVSLNTELPRGFLEGKGYD